MKKLSGGLVVNSVAQFAKMLTELCALTVGEARRNLV